MCSKQRLVKIVYAKKQQQAVTRGCLVGTEKSRMVVGTPLMQAEQDSSIRVQNLAEKVVGRFRAR